MSAQFLLLSEDVNLVVEMSGENEVSSGKTVYVLYVKSSKMGN